MPASFPSSAAPLTSARLACSPPASFEPAAPIAGDAAERKQHGAMAALPQLVLGAGGPLTGSSREPTLLEQRVARILSNKRIAELYTSWMPWQQSALLAGILDRCPTDQLTTIYKAVGCRGADVPDVTSLQSIGSSPPRREEQLARGRWLQRELSRAIDAVFSHRKSWRQLCAQRRQRKKALSAAERSHAARTTLYRYSDPARFSSEIERALCTLLQRSGVEFTYGGAAAGLLTVDTEPRAPAVSTSADNDATTAPPEAIAKQQSMTPIQPSTAADQKSLVPPSKPVQLQRIAVSGGDVPSLAASELQAVWSSLSEVPPSKMQAVAVADTGSAATFSNAAAVQPSNIAQISADEAGEGSSSSSELVFAEPGEIRQGDGSDLQLVTTSDLLPLQQDSTIAVHGQTEPTAAAVEASPTEDNGGIPRRRDSRRVSVLASCDPTIGRFSSDVMTAVMTKGGPHASDEEVSEIVAETILATATDLGLYDSQADHLTLSPARAQQLRERISGDVAAAVLQHRHIHLLLQLQQQQAQEPIDARRLPAGMLDSQKIAPRKQAGKQPAMTTDKLLHRVAKHGVRKPLVAAVPHSFIIAPPASPEPSLSTIASSSKQSAATLDYFPDRPLQKYGGLRRGVASLSGGSSVDISIPLQATYKSVKFSYGINEEFLVKPNRTKLAAVYHSQQREIWKAIETWRPSDIMTLVVDLVKVSSDDILAVLRAALSAKSHLVRNVNDLPDRLLLYVFKLLDPDDLERAQEVCQQWHYLCSRPEVWMQKCDELGAALGLPRLSARLRSEAVMADHSDAAIDWKLCYYELERLLVGRSSTRLPAAGSTATVTVAGKPGDRGAMLGHRRVAQRQLHLPPQPSAAAAATSLPSFDSAAAATAAAVTQAFSAGAELQDEHAASQPMLLADLAAPETAGHRRTVRHKLKPVHIEPLAGTSYDRHVADGKSGIAKKDAPFSAASEATTAAALVAAAKAERNSRHRQDGRPRQASEASILAAAFPAANELSAQRLRLAPANLDARVPEVITDFRGQPSVTAALPTAAQPNKHTQQDLAADGNPSAVAHNSVTVRESSSTSGTGIEILAKKKIMIQAGEVALDIRTTLKPTKNLVTESQEVERNTGSPLLEWADPDSCNLRDPAIQKRCKAIVKEVCCVRRFQGHLDYINCVAFDKRRAFTGSADHVIFMWDLHSGELVRQMVGHTGSVRCLQLDSYRNVLYSGSWDESIIVWDVVKFKSTALLLGHEGVVTSLKLSSDGTILVSASTDSTVRMWSTTTYSCQWLLRSHSHSSALHCLWFDGLLLAAGGEEGVLSLYDCSTSKLDREYFVPSRTASAAASADARGQHVSSGSGRSGSSSRGDDNGATDSSSPRDQKPQAELSKSQTVTSVTIVNDLIVAGLSGGELCCWDRLTAQAVASFSVHRGSIVAMAFCYGRLLTAGSDGLVKEWELGTMACVRVLRGHQSAIRAMEVREIDDRIVTVGDDKLVHVWDLRQRKKPPAPARTSDNHLGNMEQALHTWLPTADDRQK